MPRYKTIKIGGRTVSLHRYVMECHLGHPIPEDHVVHHKDGDRLNNDICNLELMTYEAHARHHNQKHPRTKLCAACGRRFTPAPTKRKRAKTCSRPCFKELARRQALERAQDSDYRSKLSAAAHRNGSAERAKTLVVRTRWKDHVPERLSAICACGCGASFSPYRKREDGTYYKRGHHRRRK